jgi:transposase
MGRDLRFDAHRCRCAGLAMVAVAITRTEMTAAELRARAAGMEDARAVRRVLAIALVLEGGSREEAARATGMDRQTLRDWVHRYNAGGLDGLINRQAPGREPALTEAQEQELIRWVDAGPDLAKDGVVRWRRVDLRDRILREFGVTLHERTVGKMLEKHNYCRLSVRPQHPKSDPAAQDVFKTDFADLVRATIPSEAAGKPLEIWWQDEARVGQQGTLTRVWAKRGTRPRAMRDQRRNSAYLFGAVCPERDTGAAIIMPQANTEAMNQHLAEISCCVTERAYAVLIVDGAGWHTASRLVVPHNIGLLKLPPYAPELNPAENIWEYLRGNFLSHVVYDSYQTVVAACRKAWKRLLDTPNRIRSIATRDWAQVNL